MELVSNVMFARSGDENLIIDVIASILAMVNECMMILLLMMMVSGWMTLWLDVDPDEVIEVHVPLFLLVIMIHLVFACLSFIDRNAYHKYHDFQGYVGVGLVFAKFILLCPYYYFYYYTHGKVPNTFKFFYQQIVQIGLFYLLSDPVLILSTYMLNEWNMAFYYSISDQLVHLGLQCYFLYHLKKSQSLFQKSLD